MTGVLLQDCCCGVSKIPEGPCTDYDPDICAAVVVLVWTGSQYSFFGCEIALEVSLTYETHAGPGFYGLIGPNEVTINGKDVTDDVGIFTAIGCTEDGWGGSITIGDAPTDCGVGFGVVIENLSQVVDRICIEGAYETPDPQTFQWVVLDPGSIVINPA